MWLRYVSFDHNLKAQIQSDINEENKSSAEPNHEICCIHQKVTTSLFSRMKLFRTRFMTEMYLQ